MARDISPTPSRNERHFPNSLPFCVDIVECQSFCHTNVLLFDFMDPAASFANTWPGDDADDLSDGTFPSLLPTARLETTQQKALLTLRTSPEGSRFRAVLHIGLVY